MRQVYCDTSVVTPLFIAEPTTTSVERWMTETNDVVISSAIVHVEFYSAIARHVRERSLTPAAAAEVIDSFEGWFARQPATPLPDMSTYTTARSIVRRFDLGCRAPDALHLALALRAGASFATFDRRQRSAAVAFGIPVLDISPD